MMKYVELSWEFATEKLWILLWFSSTEERPWAMQTLEQTPEMHCLPPYAQQLQHRAQYRALAGSFIYMWELMCFRLYPFWIAYILVYSWKLMGWKHSLAVNCIYNHAALVVWMRPGQSTSLVCYRGCRCCSRCRCKARRSVKSPLPQCWLIMFI